MKFYLKYILLGVVIGLLILGLLSLVGCEDKDFTPYNEHDLEVNLRILGIEERQAFDRGLIDWLNDFVVTDVNETTKLAVNVNRLIGVVEKMSDFDGLVVARLEKLEVEPNEPLEIYLADIDPNAPINTHLLKISDSWAKEYGTSHESVLKYNTVAAWAFAQRALHLIAELDKRVKVLEQPVPISIKALLPEIIDPNEAGEGVTNTDLELPRARTALHPDYLNEVKE